MMSGKISTRSLFILLLLLFSSHWVWASSRALIDDPSISPEKLQALKNKISRVSTWINRAENQKNSVEKALHDSEQKISLVSKEIHGVRKKIANSLYKIQSLRKTGAKLNLSVKKQQSYLQQQIRITYLLGRQPVLKILLNQDNPQNLSRMLNYYDYFNKARTQQITQYRNSIKQLADIRKQIINENKTLTQTRASLLKKRNILKLNQITRQNVLVHLSKSILSQSIKLKKYNSNRNHLEVLLKKVEKALTNLSLPNENLPFNLLRGKLTLPVRGRIIERYGSNTSNRKIRSKGIFILAPENAEVHAVYYGRVVFSNWIRGYGLIIIIDHGGGYMTLYGHNNSLLKSTGDWVHTGETIALAGDSGGANKTGLYFELRKNGKARNPTGWFRHRRR